MKRGHRYFLWLSVIWLLILGQSSLADTNQADITWRSQDIQGQTEIHLYFFWSRHCPHCQDARPYVETLPDTHPWLRVHSLEITQSHDNLIRYQEIASAVGQTARSVPAFFVCGTPFIGWDEPESIGRMLLERAKNCLDENTPANPAAQGAITRLPLVGDIDINGLSLPLFTLVIAGLDAFNPCAFFILLFLLSLMVHARSRGRMLLVGMTFVTISGLVYFMFMAAWLNLFLLVGGMPFVSLAAGLLALLIGGFNTREFFYSNNRVSLTIPEASKPGLFKRMGSLLSTDSLPTLLTGTITLAIAANSYELLCTAGFPMVYTRTLTLHQLGETTYYLYLALYNLIYIIPLMIIVLIFTATLGSRKLSESEGRLLKLVSGIMMLLLGCVLIIAPEVLSHFQTGILLLLTAVILTAGIRFWEKSSS
ncbi:MAG: hypothetical protein ABW162_07320 [Candidatus Sedimenticola sp. PURPLELP]